VKEISLHLLDVIENAVAAGAQRVEILIEEDPGSDLLRIVVTDDGRGMPPDLVRAATDAFTTTRETRKVGLGIPLLAAAAEQAGGTFAICSEPGRGTSVRADFQLSHIDRAPLGRLEDSLAAAAALHPDLDLTLRHSGPLGAYEIDTRGLAADRPSGAAGRIRALVSEGRARIGSTA
jgi:hypothetical protein